MKTVRLTQSLFILYVFLLVLSQIHAKSDHPDKGKNLITLEYMVSNQDFTEVYWPECQGNSFIEIRSYNIISGKRDEFHQIVKNSVVPLMKKSDSDLIGFGPSLHDENSYFLIRSYDSLAEREKELDELYRSENWIKSAREISFSMIDNYTTIVLSINPEFVNHLKQNRKFELPDR